MERLRAERDRCMRWVRESLPSAVERARARQLHVGARATERLAQQRLAREEDGEWRAVHAEHAALSAKTQELEERLEFLRKAAAPLTSAAIVGGGGDTLLAHLRGAEQMLASPLHDLNAQKADAAARKDAIERAKFALDPAELARLDGAVARAGAPFDAQQRTAEAALAIERLVDAHLDVFRPFTAWAGALGSKISAAARAGMALDEVLTDACVAEALAVADHFVRFSQARA